MTPNEYLKSLISKYRVSSAIQGSPAYDAQVMLSILLYTNGLVSN